MERLFVAVIAALFTATKNLVVVGLAVGLGMLIASFLCDIYEQEAYSWFSGIWHGLFFIPNYARSILNPSVLYKAFYFSTMYNVFWWIVVVLQIPTMLTLFYKLVIEPLAAAFMVASDN